MEAITLNNVPTLIEIRLGYLIRGGTWGSLVAFSGLFDQARLTIRRRATPELQRALEEKLMGLADAGVKDPQQLRSPTLEIFDLARRN